MIVDGEHITEAAVGGATVAIVGAGPAGIVTALELSRSHIKVLLIESGGLRFSEETQGFGTAENIGNSGHVPMNLATRRQVGGATNIWGGRCVPYDPIDFDNRAYVKDAAWPVSYEQLLPWFQPAAEWCRIGRPIFTSEELPELSYGDLTPDFSSDNVLARSIERWSLPTNFGRLYLRDIRASPTLTLISGLTCVEIELDASGSATHAVCRSSAGRMIRIGARWFVIAAGGLESTRLLLASNHTMSAGIGNHSGHLGRWYMSHVSGKIAQIALDTNPASTSYAYERDADGVYCRRRISFSREFLNQHGLPNIVFWLVNPELANPQHRSGVLSFAYLALRSPAGRVFAPDAIRQAHIY